MLFFTVDWNIMSNNAMSQLASEVPTSIEELSILGALGENVIKEYGERLVKNIKAYIDQENLQVHLEKHKGRKRHLPSESAPENGRPSAKKVMSKNVLPVQNDDEFDIGIDFSSIEIPNAPVNDKSSYF